MSNLLVAENIANVLGGRLVLTQLMRPKHFMGGESSLGIRLNKASKNKINHIEITKKQDLYTIDFWAFGRDFENNTKVATYDVAEVELKNTIEKETHFVFPTGNPEHNKEIAENILVQLGGAPILNMMIGVEAKLPIENGLQLIFKCKTHNNVNVVEIVLNSSDLYDVCFLTIRPNHRTVVSETKGIYADMLVSVFEEGTGLTLHMPRFI